MSSIGYGPTQAKTLASVSPFTLSAILRVMRYDSAKSAPEPMGTSAYGRWQSTACVPPARKKTFIASTPPPEGWR